MRSWPANQAVIYAHAGDLPDCAKLTNNGADALLNNSKVNQFS